MSRATSSGAGALLKDFRIFAGARLWLALALMVLGALAEGFGLLMIVPLAAIAVGGEHGALPAFARFADWLPDGDRLLVALGLFVLAMALRSLLLFARDVEVAKLQSAYEASLRLRAAATLASRGWPFASRIGQAGMQALLLGDVPRAGMAITYLQGALIAATMLAVQLALSAILSPALTAIALAVLAIGALSSLYWTRRGVVSGMAISETAEESASSGFRLHAGLKAALAQGTVSPFLDEYRRSLGRAAAQLVAFNRDYSSARQLASLGAALAAALLLFAGIRILALPFPVLIASLTLFARMTGPAQSLQQSVHNMAAYAPSFGAIVRRLGPLDSEGRTQALAPRLDWSELTVGRASFEHQPGLGPRKVSLNLKRGEWVGISGKSGSGKTTLADLVAGLLEPQDGAITIDSAPLSGPVLQQWRSSLAYVGQDPVVFNDSIRGNLLAEGANADEQAQWRALELAGLADRVRAFPRGLDESVGDRGSQLSGGERQRLAIARALLRQPRLLILDEATAALDTDGEAALLKRLRAIEPRPAAIVVAHRASTLASCDSVVSIRHEREEKSGE